MKRLHALGLVRGTQALPPTLVQAIHEERLVGGLSISIRATADEVVVWLANAIGGEGRTLKVLDVSTNQPTRLDLEISGERLEWVVSSLEQLVSVLNAYFVDDDAAKVLVVLGEFERMLHLWALTPDVLEVLLSTQLLNGARNINELREQFEG